MSLQPNYPHPERPLSVLILSFREALIGEAP